jgi:acetyl-CoA C-acetyltransferase
MAMDPRTPVIIGVGQYLQRAQGLDDAEEAIDLMVRAAGAAASDAGLSSVPDVDSARVVSLLSFRYKDAARLVVDRLGISTRETAVTTAGGNSPQTLMNVTASEIQAGDLDLALLTGGEAWRTRMRARREGVMLPWTKQDDDVKPDRVIGADQAMFLPEEQARGIIMPVQIYPMFETALRSARGEDVDDHQVRVSELWATFSAVAGGNPFAWQQSVKTAEEIRTPGPSNRMIGLPYPKLMNSNNDVDMAAALLVASVAKAEALGVPRDRWVFPHSGADCHDTYFVSNRQSFASCPAIGIGGRTALELAGLTIDDIDLVDLYSCFPSAVQLGAAALGLSLDRQLTRTGGLPFAGGPWNNYVMHAIASMVNDLREQPGARGLVWANGGYATKHSFGTYSTEPPEKGFRRADPQPEIDALPSRDLALPADAAGPAVIEGFTVMHDRDGKPETALASCLLEDGRRAWGSSNEPDTAEALCEGEWVGRRVSLKDDGTLIP